MAVVLDLLNSDPRKEDEERPRHPEKAHRPDQPIARKPDWIRVKAPGSPGWAETNAIVKANKLVTVCEEAGCPNMGECWDKKHATFMIMGDTCTRACAFCNVKTGLPGPLDAAEPGHIGEATAKLGLAHVVVTSVDRDDLDDGGAAHFAAVIAAIRAAEPRHHHRDPDARTSCASPARWSASSRRSPTCSTTISKPCRRNISPCVPARAISTRLRLLQKVKELDPDIFTKSGHHGRAGRGAQRSAAADGRPALGGGRFPDHRPISAADAASIIRSRRFVPPEQFKAYEIHRLRQGLFAGFGVAADPLVASRGRGFRTAARAAARVARVKRRCRAFAPAMSSTTRRSRCSIWWPMSNPIRNSCRCASRCACARRFAGTDGAEVLTADMEVGYKAIRETFTSRVTLDRACAANRRRICRWPVQPSRKHVALRRGRWRQVPDRILHRL